MCHQSCCVVAVSSFAMKRYSFVEPSNLHVLFFMFAVIPLSSNSLFATSFWYFSYSERTPSSFWSIGLETGSAELLLPTSGLIVFHPQGLQSFEPVRTELLSPEGFVVGASSQCYFLHLYLLLRFPSLRVFLLTP